MDAEDREQYIRNSFGRKMTHCSTKSLCFTRHAIDHGALSILCQGNAAHLPEPQESLRAIFSHSREQDTDCVSATLPRYRQKKSID